MGMREEFESAGNWLFRRRGYLPLLLFPLVLYATWHSPDRTTPGARWNALCVALAIGGLTLRGATVGFVPKDTSQRNTGRPQAEALNTTGSTRWCGIPSTSATTSCGWAWRCSPARGGRR